MSSVAVDPKCTDPQELYGLGVRAYVLQDYGQSIEALSRAAELLVQEHKDDCHESLGKVYLFYGKALLGSARDNSEALGDAVPKNAQDESEDSEVEEDEGIEAEAADKAPEVNGDAEPETEENGVAEPETEEAKEPEEEDEPSDLELAWQVLELAKKILEKQEDKKQLAETLIALGEVSLENDNLESGVNDIKQGLELQKALYATDSRTVAETLYKLGMAYCMNGQMQDAINSFQAALMYLNNRIKTLEETKSQTDELRDEISEIRALMPDIEDKIAEMRVYKDEVCVYREIVKHCKNLMCERAAEEEENLKREETSGSVASSSGQVNRIEVRRKEKKPDKGDTESND